MRRVLVFLAAALVASGAWAGEPIKTLDRAGARQLVDPARHDWPAIVALWSTDCPHCKKNLALYARLAREANLRLVTVAVEPLHAGLAAPLDKLGVPGARYAYGDDASEALAYALDPEWRGELPRSLFFDGRGGRLTQSGVVDEVRVRQALGLRRLFFPAASARRNPG